MSGPKKEVDPLILERLAKGRAIDAERRKELAAKKQMAKDVIAGEVSKINGAEQVEQAVQFEKSEEPEEIDVPSSPEQLPVSIPAPKSKKSQKVMESSDSDSSTDSSDTSDSDVPVQRKRSKKKITSDKLKLSLEKAKEKYRARYKSRYEMLAAVATKSKKEPEPVDEIHHDPIQSSKPQAPNMKRVARQMARNTITSALNKELLESTVKNLLGL